MSAQAYSWALAQRTGSPSAKAVLLSIANYAGEDGQCFPSLRTLAFDTEQSIDSVRRRIQLLQEAGLIAIFERSKSNGGQTSSEYVLLYSDGARRYAESFGAPVARPSKVLDVETPLADCEGGGVAYCEAPPSTAAIPPLAAVRPPYEPSLEPSIEDSPPAPLSGGAGASTACGLGTEGSEASWEAQWREFDTAYPWQFTDRKGRAKDVFTSLDPDARRSAVRYARAYGDAAAKANRKVLNAATWLSGRGWEVLEAADKAATGAAAAKQALFGGKVWVEAGTPQSAAWRRHHSKPPFYYDRSVFDGGKGYGRAEPSEWPPSRSSQNGRDAA